MSERNMSEIDTQFSLGKLIIHDAKRDAIHIAVAPVVATEILKPGQRIGFAENHDKSLVCGFREDSKVIGIVDPFLTLNVKVGQRFWMFLLPNTITSLRHQWEHPAFVATESEAWLREFAARYEADYTEMVQGAISGGGVCFASDIEYGDFQPNSEFWHHIQMVTGKNFTSDHQENTQFRCAC